MLKPVRVFTFLTVAIVSLPLLAQEKAAAKTSEAVVEKSKEAAQSMLSTVKQAVAGDAEAISELGSRFILPALIALGVLCLGYFAASFFGRIVGGTISRRVDVTFGKFAGRMTKNVIMLLVIMAVLNQFGVDVTSFAAIIAALGFAIGMALQGTLANFAAGVMLLVFRPFKVGDYIQVGSEEGKVEEIDLFTTRLNTSDNLHKIVPNGQIFGSSITNYTRNEVRRVEVNVGCDYSADLDYTRAVLQTAISEIPGAASEPGPQVVLTGLGDSCVNWQVRVWCEPAEYWSVRELLTVATKKGLDLNGVGIPFPQMEMRVVGLPSEQKLPTRRAA